MIKLRQGNTADVLRGLESESVQCCVTSPPYYALREYQTEPQQWDAVEYSPMPGMPAMTIPAMEASLGMEPTIEAYIGHLVAVFRDVWRVLRADGTVFLNIADSYCGSNSGGIEDNKATAKGSNSTSLGKERPSKSQSALKPKDLMGVPWRLAFALQADGWWLRQAITWCKGSPMPESVTDRPTSATEMVFLLTKSLKYFYDSESVRILSNSLNPSYSREKVGFKVGYPSPSSFPAEGGDVSFYNEWSPYFILSAFLTMQGVFVKKGDDLFSQLLNILKFPCSGGLGFSIVVECIMEFAPKIVVDIFKHLSVVFSKCDLNGKPKLWVRLGSFPDTVEGYNTALSVKKPREIIAKIIANAQIIRDAFCLDFLSKNVIDINLIDQAVSLFKCADFNSCYLGDSVITKSLIEKFRFEFSKVTANDFFSGEGHDNISLFGSLTPHNCTTAPQSNQGHNLWNWWHINQKNFSGAHFATFPPDLVEPCILAGSRKGDTVLDPFLGAGTTALVADRLGRDAIGIELNPEYLALAESRIRGDCPLFTEVESNRRLTA